MSDALQDAITDFLNQLRAAWDAGDARAYAAKFTGDATYVIFLGEALIGREEIERNHVDVFKRWQKGTKMVVKAVGVHSLGPDICSVLTVGGIGKKADVPYDKIQTFTLVRRGENWLCAGFQNTAMSKRAKTAFNQ
jgi:uncharacterized protein (TIGR02246 family)